MMTIFCSIRGENPNFFRLSFNHIDGWIIFDNSISDSYINTLLASGIFKIITNLVENSIIHGYSNGEKGPISIDIKANESTLNILYSDDGKGIETSDLDKIFHPFYTTKRGDGCIGLWRHFAGIIFAFPTICNKQLLASNFIQTNSLYHTFIKLAFQTGKYCC